MNRKNVSSLSAIEDVRLYVPDQRVLTVDGGLAGTGLAIFDWPAREIKRAFPPTWTRCLTQTKGTWREMFTEVVEKFRYAIKGAGVDRMILEWPELWGRSARSYAAAKELIELTALCGAFMTAADDYLIGVHLLTVRKWKGQLGKPAVATRIKRALGRKYPNHVSDAVGIGLAVQGYI